MKAYSPDDARAFVLAGSPIAPDRALRLLDACRKIDPESLPKDIARAARETGETPANVVNVLALLIDYLLTVGLSNMTGAELLEWWAAQAVAS